LAKFSFDRMPQLQLISNEQIEEIHNRTLDILENTGVLFEHQGALEFLESKGCAVDYEHMSVRFPKEFVEQAIINAPEKFNLYNSQGKLIMELGEGHSYYAPGPGASNFAQDGEVNRFGTVADLEQAIKIMEDTKHFSMNSGSTVPSDVPKQVSDVFILYKLIMGSQRPLLAEAWEDNNSVKRIIQLLEAVTSQKDFQEKPFVILAACPSPPMKWEGRVIENAIDCMKFGIPVFACSSPVMGISAPVTIVGSVITHAVETLSLLTFMQLYKPGTPFLYGGIAGAVDMRTTYCSESGIEACMATSGFANMARYYSIPSLCFLAQSDSKETDYQAGFETAMGAMFATLSGIDIIFGAGTLDSYLASSNEKMAIDGQMLGYMNRLQDGIKVNDETLADKLISSIGWGEKGSFMETEHTFKLFRQEQYIPEQTIIDREAYEKWKGNNENILTRTQNYIKNINYSSPVEEQTVNRLRAAMLKIAKDQGVEEEVKALL
jgi:trimethylamine--corrinoid protein Co-methyltransferase